jgi:hypothetical protein
MDQFEPKMDLDQFLRDHPLSVAGGAVVSLGTLYYASKAAGRPITGLYRFIWSLRAGATPVTIRSHRKAEINVLLNHLKNLEEGQYVVVVGGKGIGKSCLIRTALEKKRGVVNIRVSTLSNTVHVMTYSFRIRFNLVLRMRTSLTMLCVQSPGYQTLPTCRM